MAAQLRPLKGREVLRKLRKAGFEIVRIEGSAYYLRNPQPRRLTSVHGNRDIPLGTLRAIVIEQAGLSPEEFNDLYFRSLKTVQTGCEAGQLETRKLGTAKALVVSQKRLLNGAKRLNDWNGIRIW
jgi:predicted RNA binding protein YcfA (HicA-like mRNA interferase family)